MYKSTDRSTESWKVSKERIEYKSCYPCVLGRLGVEVQWLAGTKNV